MTEFLVGYLYLSGVDGDALLLLKQRLVYHKSYVDGNKNMMGPIHDQHGLEQGGISLSEFYKLYNNNEFLYTLQKSAQGVFMNNQQAYCIC